MGDKKAFDKKNIMDLFNLPLSQVAFDQVLSIQQVMENSTREEQNNDAWTYSGGSAKFRPATTYKKKKCLGIMKLTQPLNGYGNHIVNQNTSSFIGYS